MVEVAVSSAVLSSIKRYGGAVQWEWEDVQTCLAHGGALPL